MTDVTASLSPPPWADGAYSIKRHGVTITNCDSEPVHTPGCVQAHGVLLVLRPGDLSVAQVSENSASLLALPPADLLERPLADAIGPGPAEQVRRFLAAERLEHNPLRVDVLPAHEGRPPIELVVHTCEGAVLLELEPVAGTADVRDDYTAVTAAVRRIRAAEGLQSLHDVAARELRELTGLDRVMIYRFHADGHGEVVAEDRRADLPPWLGLHYPAEDIPAPARRIFEQIWIRPVPNIPGELAELVPLVHPDTGRPAVLTHCVLRGPSVMYTEYLQNMDVTAALTLPIRRGDRLWGLIACHHYAGPRQLGFEARAACELVAQVVSLQHAAAAERDGLVYRLKLDGVHQLLVARAAHTGDLEALTAAPPSLLDGLDAGGVAVRHHDRWYTLGATPNPEQLAALATFLFTRAEFTADSPGVYATDRLAADHPPAADYADVAAGLLAAPLSRSRRSLVLWFRPETLQTVRWAGSPHDKPTVAGPHGQRLTPRASFELFVESVRQRSLPWTDVEVAAAARLRLLLMELVVARAEQLADLNIELRRSNEDLEAFAHVASHDLKEPLRGIHKHVSHLQSEAAALSEDGRRRLDTVARLALRMDSLIESLLHFSRVGRAGLRYHEVELGELLGEAIEMVGGRTAEKPADFVTVRPLPRIRCDRVRVREVFVNLLANALKYTDRARPRIEVGWHDPGEPVVAAPPGVTGPVYYVRDDGIGIEPRHHAQVFKMFRRLHGQSEYGGGTGAGLAIVRKLIERHRGQIWLDSAPGRGTTFYFTLPDEGEVS